MIKKEIMIIVVMMLILPIISAQQCLKNSDDYAVSVVTNKPGIDYNLNTLVNAKNLVFKEDKYIYQSHYDERMMVIITEVKGADAGGLGGLNVRVQLPTITAKITMQYLELLSRTIKGTINKENITEENLEGWVYSCDEEINPSCEFLKDNTKVSTKRDEGKYLVTIQITGGVNTCEPTCDGYCVKSGGSSTCIDKEKMESIEQLLINTGLGSSFKEITEAYTIIHNGKTEVIITKTEIEDESLSWNTAIKKELTWLKSVDVLRIQDSDIEEISNLALRGASGKNNRIVYAKNKKEVLEWIYYKDSLEPSIEVDKKCDAIQKSSSITGNVVFEGGRYSLYYLIPIGIVIIIILTITLAVFYNRLKYEKTKNKNKEREETMNKEIEKVKDKKSIKERER